jgi:MFS family permease
VNGLKPKTHISIRDFFRKYPMLFALAIVSVMANICYSTIISLVPFYFRGHFAIKNDVLIGFAISAFVLAETCLKPFAGALGDRFRRTNLLSAGLFVGIFTPMLLSRAGGPYWFILVRLIDGAGAALVWPAMIALFADTTDEQDRATAMSVFTMCLMAGMGAGVTLSPFLKALLGTYTYVFVMMSVFMGAGFVVMLVFSRRVRVDAKRQLKKSGRPAEDASFRANMRKLLSNPVVYTQLIVLFMLAFLQMFGTSMLTPTVFLFAADVLHWNEKHVWRSFLIAGVIIATLALPAGRLADRLGKENAVKIGMGLAAVCLMTMAIVKEPWTLALAVVGYGISFVIGAPSWMALVTRGEWSGMRGTVLGVVTAFQGAGVVIGPTAGTLIWGRYGHYGPFGACAGLLAVCAIMSLIGLRPIKQESPAA